MIFINPERIPLSEECITALEALTVDLCGMPADERSTFIDAKREKSWAHPDVLQALRAPAGNKCWYSEVHLEGADPNVDHFFPKGAVKEVRETEENFEMTVNKTPGYWWFAFEHRNYRLACMHSNQRRVDEATEGGKWDFFPIRNARSPEQTAWDQIKSQEDPLPLDPCSRSDARLLCFDPDGNPCAAEGASLRDQQRVRASIWLFHLKKTELHRRRQAVVVSFQKDLRKADALFKMWARGTAEESLEAKDHFDSKVAEIEAKIVDSAVFAGAKRGSARLAMAKFSWVQEYLSL